MHIGPTVTSFIDESGRSAVSKVGVSGSFCHCETGCAWNHAGRLPGLMCLQLIHTL